MDNVTLIRVIAGFLAIAGIPLYFLPAILGRKKRNAVAIFAVNLLLGWTFIGWIVALVWSLSAESQAVQVLVQGASVSTPTPQLCAKCGNYSMPGVAFCAHCGNSFLALVAVGTPGTQPPRATLN